MSYDEFANVDSRRKFSIEHIILQNRTDNEVVANKSIRPTVNWEFKKNWRHSIGNLTIDPLSANASKSNQDFEHKDQGYFRRAPLKTQMLEALVTNFAPSAPGPRKNAGEFDRYEADALQLTFIRDKKQIKEHRAGITDIL